MSFLGSAAGAVAGAIGGIISGNMSANANSAAAAQANAWNVENYKHRYQWAVEDMRNAGLNPILAATNGIGGNVNGAAALGTSYDIGGSAAAGAQAATAGENASTAKKQWQTYNQKVLSDIKVNASSAAKMDADAQRIIFETGRDKQLLPTVLETAKNNAIASAKQLEVLDAQKAREIAAANQSNSAAGYYNNLAMGAAADNILKNNKADIVNTTGVNPDVPIWMQVVQGAKHFVGQKAKEYSSGYSDYFGGD